MAVIRNLPKKHRRESGINLPDSRFNIRRRCSPWSASVHIVSVPSKSFIAKRQCHPHERAFGRPVFKFDLPTVGLQPGLA